MTTTNRYHHLRGLLPSKPPPWRHRHWPRHLLIYYPSLPTFSLFVGASRTPHPTSYYPPSQHHPNVPFTLATRSQPNPGLQPRNKIYPLQLPPPFLPPHYPTIPSHRNDLLPTTTSTTHGTHRHPHCWSNIPHTHPTHQFLRYPPPERELYMHLNTGTSHSLHKPHNSHANPRFAQN